MVTHTVFGRWERFARTTSKRETMQKLIALRHTDYLAACDASANAERGLAALELNMVQSVNHAQEQAESSRRQITALQERCSQQEKDATARIGRLEQELSDSREVHRAEGNHKEETLAHLGEQMQKLKQQLADAGARAETLTRNNGLLQEQLECARVDFESKADAASQERLSGKAAREKAMQLVEALSAPSRGG